jgi:hypothetical protein
VISVTIDTTDIKRIQSVLNGARATVGKELSAAINKTAKKVTTMAAREIGKVLNLPIKTIKKTIKQKSKANKEKTSATIGFWEGYPVPLKFFKPRQLKSGKGVSYRANKTKPATGFVSGGFIVQQYGGNVYKRQANTKARGPLIKQHGPKPGWYFEETGVVSKATEFAKTELPKQIEARIRYLTLKAQGQLRGKQTGRY